MIQTDNSGYLTVYSYRSARPKQRKGCTFNGLPIKVDRNSPLVKAMEEYLNKQHLLDNHILVVDKAGGVVWFFHDVNVFIYDINLVDIVEGAW